jgi:peroxiredoxin Q/BCP
LSAAYRRIFLRSLLIDLSTQLLKGRRLKMSELQLGDRTPDFTWVAQSGEQVRLSDFRRRKVVVLFFYPKDGSAICTREACAFRDAYDQFAEAGAVVIGVSGDSAESHSAFATRHNLPFYLVSDEDRSIREAFGVPKSFGLLPGRVTYVIDSEGVVRLVFSAQLTADRHVSEALRVVEELVRASK